MTLAITALPGRPADWDTRIADYGSKTVFHESAWLDHVLTIHPRARMDYLRIADADQTVGLFCALRLRKLFLTVCGSPLPGTGTNYMGPLVDRDADMQEVVTALMRYYQGQHVAHVELAHDWLDPDAMGKVGVRVERSVTHVVPLPPNEEEAFAQLKSTCRNRVRKAGRNGLTAEVTDDPAIVDRFYEQFIEVYAKQGMVVPFGIERPRSLFENLHPAQRLLPVWVKNGAEVIAAGLFPFDERAIYFWGAASWLKDQHLCPNELLHWTVIREAVKRGIPLYNMCGGASQFKDKFGGTDVPYNHFSRSFVPFLDHGRRLYRSLHWQKLRLVGRLRGVDAGVSKAATSAVPDAPSP